MKTTDEEQEQQLPSFPFLTEPDDHCESPLSAYEHIVPILKLACQSSSGINKSGTNATIYDPYYCNGAVVRNLNQLGFPNVHNVKQDCYVAWQSPQQELPSFDVLVTNPPYSGDHVSSSCSAWSQKLQNLRSLQYGPLLGCGMLIESQRSTTWIFV